MTNQNIYIQDGPGLGKTEIVDYFLTGKSYWKAGEASNFVFGTLPDNVDYVWFEDFDLNKYHGNVNNLLSLMDKKETAISRKCVDDKIVTLKAKFIFTSHYQIPQLYNMFSRRVEYLHVCHKMFDCTGCRPDYIPDNQLGLLTNDGDQLLIDLSLQSNFTLDISDENARDGLDGLNNIMTQEQIEQFFESL